MTLAKIKVIYYISNALILPYKNNAVKIMSPHWSWHLLYDPTQYVNASQGMHEEKFASHNDLVF